MIRNLNQVSFQGFGFVPPERSQIAGFDKTAATTWNLRQEEPDIYRSVSDTWICSATGSSVLFVSLDGNAFQNYYLDKAVCLKAGISFALQSFTESSSILMFAQEPPRKIDTRSLYSLQMAHRIWVDSISTFFYQEKEQGFLFPGESHPMAELTYVDQGSLHSVADGQDLLLKQGDLVIYGPNQWHMQYADIVVAPRFVTLSFSTDSSCLSDLMNRKFTAPQPVVTALQIMLRELDRMDDFSSDIILSQLNMLLLLLMRETVSPTGGKLQTSNAIHSENEIIRQAQQFISAHIREKLSVPLVARQVDVSPSYLTALFHKNLQISPGEYIRRIKLQESKQMIRENNLNFTEIAAALQYSTVHHFSRQFKEKFGITPTEYAKSVR